MAFPKNFEDVINFLKTKMFQLVENFCESLRKKSKEEVCLDLIELESKCSEDMADAVDAQVNNNSESSPLLREKMQEFRRRVCQPSGSYSPPGPNQHFESNTSMGCYDWILVLFQELLQRLQQKFRNALDWLKQTAAACLRGLRKVAETIWEVLKGICSSLEQLFKSLIQV